MNQNTPQLTSKPFTYTNDIIVIPNSPNKRITAVEPEIVDLDLGHDKLMKALYWVWDMFDRSNQPFFLVHDTAEQAIKHHALKGSKVEVGIRRNEWNSGATRVLLTIMGEPLEFTQSENEEGYDIARFEHEGVPVFVYIYPDAECVMQLDSIHFQHEWFKVPNPYTKFKELYGF